MIDALLPTLYTPRLTVRPLTLADAPAFTAYHNDPELALYQSWDMPYPLEQAKAHAREMQAAPSLREDWSTLMLSADGLTLGNLSLRLTGHRTAEIGFTLARAHWGKGYAAEGLSALLDWLFTQADLHRVHASLDPRNARSEALLKRAGLRSEGCSVQAYWHRGEWSDDAHYALLQSEWQEKHDT
ncbi:GNAT family N-acetyltransferase [Deinococcus rubellus]|uniref:GNAT family N-acetyltransferase n=1 Tax=Deinococcus rubellus TaxID=1889240 RepID=A0ABY5YF58_9DEIO|nr:GNAT family N-acetyltransferase [Deinococcus rubellus]UWX63346.1 GNAT family N-acetyltransferase [Deinococcus rubellus]